MFSSYASNPAESRGRLHIEEGSAHRSGFQRDRDRIIHSSAFRRLKHKTQVFVEHEGDYFRTRLTHSIEVAQVARTIAGVLGLNVELTEAVALAHDLGHTPFGHTGEEALDACMLGYGGFDHNAQSIRIVTSLERHYAEFDGLNLTWETLEGIAKHNGPVTGDVPYGLADYNSRHDLEISSFASAEAQVAALSDDIAYNNHDLDDGLRAGLFTFEEIGKLPAIEQCLATVDQKYPGLDAGRRRHETLRRLFGVMVDDLLAESGALLDGSGAHSVAEIRALDAPVVRFSAVMQSQIDVIRAFLFERMYRHWTVQRMRRKAKMIVEELFSIFMENPGLMPPEWHSQCVEQDECHRARVIADYVSGMTDRFALQEHRKLTDPMLKG